MFFFYFTAFGVLVFRWC